MPARGKPSPSPSPRLIDAEAEVLRYAHDFPDFGQARVAAELRSAGIKVSPSGVRHIWQQHGLETAYQRLKALGQSPEALAGLSPSQRELLRRGDVSRKLEKKHRQQLIGGSEASADGGDGAAARRSTILAAAAQLFSERGYDGASIRDLAQKVGLLPGSVYHHFRSKEELFVSVHREGFQQLITAVEEAIAKNDDPWQRLEGVCNAHIRALVAGNTISTVTGVSLFSLHDARLKARLQPDRDRYEEIFIGLLADIDLPPQIDRTLLRMFLFGAINWTLVWFRPGKKEPEDIARQLVAMLRRS